MLDGSTKWFLRATKDAANRRDIVRDVGFRAPSGHPDRCLVGISLILLCRAWSKLDVQAVVCNWIGDPFKAWVAGSSPAALTIFAMKKYRAAPLRAALLLSGQALLPRMTSLLTCFRMRLLRTFRRGC
jgi:hypothetical protein